MIRVLFVCHDVSGNTAGRLWALSLVADRLGWDWRVIAGASGDPWPALRGLPFLDRITIGGPRLTRSIVSRAAATPTDLVIPIKALPGSLGVTHHLRDDVPILVDMDDDDLGDWQRSITTRQRLGIIRPTHWWRGSHPSAIDRLAELVPTLPRMVSNPRLQEAHGGSLVPHARPELWYGDGYRPDRPTRLTVGFIGTPRPHKGLDILRAAVADRQSEGGWDLVVTAPAPEDARPWERWLGSTSLRQLPELLRQVDVLAAPSDTSEFARMQSPVKIIDAMLARRPVLGADLAVQRWMTGGWAVHVAVTDRRGLAAGLDELADAGRRSQLALAAHEHALSLFTVEAVAPRLSAAASEAMR